MKTSSRNALLDPQAAFVAIDFETANSDPLSACAVALVRVERLTIVQREMRLLCPPDGYFEFTHIHGITWETVKDQPSFAEAWPRLTEILRGTRFLAAHYAAFDRGVLQACCRAAAITPPPIPFQCSMHLARRTWGVYPTKLPDVCKFLKLPLNHHDPSSDAEACARIVIAALRTADARPYGSSCNGSTKGQTG